ncbi:hypothetical protein MJD09_17445 [bacterium]|nr:hypothetical protein [bacterium]
MILYEMLTGKHPFAGDYEHAVMYSIVNEDPEPLETHHQNVPVELVTIIEKALTKKHEERYQTMDELLTDLDTLDEELDTSKAATAAFRARVRRRKLNKLLRPLAVALVAALVALVYFWPNPEVEADQVSIAVLPLKGIGEAQEKEWFQDSMTDEVITSLTKIRGLRVISRTSIMGYKTNPKPIPEIGDELNVDFVVDGTVVKIGDNVKIAAALIEAQENRNVWAHSYQRNLGDVLKLQAEIAVAIANQVQVELTPQEEIRFESTRQVNPEAHEAYLKGRHHFNRITVEGVLTSVEYFEKAIVIDSTYALPYVGLAESYSFLGGGATAAESPKEMYTKATAAVQKAIELDPALSESYRVLGGIKRHWEWDFSAAIRQYKKVFELNPSDATAHIFYAQLLNGQGKHEEAIKEAEIAKRLDPLNTFVSMNLAARYNIAGQYENAISESQNTLELSPTFPLAHFMLAWAYHGLTNLEQAGRSIEKAYSLEKGNPMMISSLAVYHIKRGNREKGMELLKTLEEEAKHSYVLPSHFARIYAALEERDRAIEILEKAFEARHEFVLYLKNIDVFDAFSNLRSDSRFIELLDKIDRTVVAD